MKGYLYIFAIALSIVFMATKCDDPDDMYDDIENDNCHKSVTLINNSNSHILVLQYSEQRTYDRNHIIKESYYYFRNAFSESDNIWKKESILPPHSSVSIPTGGCIEKHYFPEIRTFYICDIKIDKNETYRSLYLLEHNPYILRKVYLQDSLESLRGNDYTIYYP